ncbi:beta strand repeat-containing protein [Frigoriglobus tundricola]|uniref:Uncharacterized protein n=1 Tax=Frigoriglobus tundricola TaxID=2774151 RepID=A0A6M5Z2U0_9BACT|nr:autotransporter-associated beta strand repeat-containing protein [Frigoriglobus tundricola]QJX00047.1 hypothetical protein FTUN_7670 [Frigoriglobus tundricola]
MPSPAPQLELLERRDVPVTTFVWNGGGANQLWSTSANWVGGVAPTASTADPTGVVIQLNGNTQSTMDVNGLTVDQIDFVGNDNEVTIATGTALGLNGGVLADNVVSGGTGNRLDNQDGSPTSTSELDMVGSAPVFRADLGDDLTVQAFITGTQGLTKLGAGEFDLRNLTVGRSFSGSVDLMEGTTYLGSRAPDYPYGFGITVQDSLTVGDDARVVVEAGGFNELGPSGQKYNGQAVREGTATVSLGAGASLEFPEGGFQSIKSLSGRAGSQVVLGNNSGIYVGFPLDPAEDVEFDGSFTGAGSVYYANLGTWTLGGSNTFDGTVSVIAGTLRAGATDALSARSQIFLYDTTLDLNNFDQTVGGVSNMEVAGTSVDNSRVLLGSATLTIDSVQPDAVFIGTISGTGGLTLSGPGRLSLSGANDYTGPTVVRDGAVLNLNGTEYTDITLDDSTLDGNGTTGDVDSSGGGLVSPGNSPGRITVGALTLGATDALTMQLYGTAAGTEYDQIVAHGPVSLAGTQLNIELGFTPAPGTSFTILSNQSGVAIAGGFAGLPEGAEFITGGVTFRITYHGGVGNDVVLTVPAEPPPAVPSVTRAGSVSVAFGPQGEVLEVIDSTGTLTQYDAAGAHAIIGGVADASVAFGPNGQVFLITYQDGSLVQYDAAGTHVLIASGVSSATLAFGPQGEVLEVIDSTGLLTQYSATGALALAGGVASASATFGPNGEHLLVTSRDGTLTLYTATGALALAGGVASASATVGPNGETYLLLHFDGSLVQYDPSGVHPLGTVV